MRPHGPSRPTPHLPSPGLFNADPAAFHPLTLFHGRKLLDNRPAHASPVVLQLRSFAFHGAVTGFADRVLALTALSSAAERCRCRDLACDFLVVPTHKRANLATVRTSNFAHPLKRLADQAELATVCRNGTVRERRNPAGSPPMTAWKQLVLDRLRRQADSNTCRTHHNRRWQKAGSLTAMERPTSGVGPGPDKDRDHLPGRASTNWGATTRQADDCKASSGICWLYRIFNAGGTSTGRPGTQADTGMESEHRTAESRCCPHTGQRRMGEARIQTFLPRSADPVTPAASQCRS